LPFNCLLDAISHWRQTVQNVAVGLKQWIEYDDEDNRYGDISFALHPGALSSDWGQSIGLKPIDWDPP